MYLQMTADELNKWTPKKSFQYLEDALTEDIFIKKYLCVYSLIPDEYSRKVYYRYIGDDGRINCIFVPDTLTELQVMINANPHGHNFSVSVNSRLFADLGTFNEDTNFETSERLLEFWSDRYWKAAWK